jgi:hypothetical protein
MTYKALFFCNTTQPDSNHKTDYMMSYCSFNERQFARNSDRKLVFHFLIKTNLRAEVQFLLLDISQTPKIAEITWHTSTR